LKRYFFRKAIFLTCIYVLSIAREAIALEVIQTESIPNLSHDRLSQAVDKKVEDKDEEETEITVTGQKPIFSPTSAPIYIVPKEEIEKSRPSSLAEILRGLPGFAINNVGFGADIHTGTFYRGQSINNSVFLLNGRPIGSNISTYHGGTDLNSIPVDAIERIELSSGTAATLYGSEAFGGVVNIITKQNVIPPQANAGIEFGSYGFSRYRINYGGSTEALNYFLGYERLSANNRYAVPVGAANRDSSGLLFNGDIAIDNFYGSVGVKVNDRSTLTLDGYKTASRRGLLYFGFPLQRDRLDHDLLNIGLSFQTRLGDGNDSQLFASLGYNQDYFNTYGPTGGNFFRTGTLDSQAITARVEHQWQTSSNNNLTWGVDFQNNALNGTALSTLPSAIAFNDNQSRNRIRAALFALNTLKLTDTFQLYFKRS
jgi:vitamin B12 transporter